MVLCEPCAVNRGIDLGDDDVQVWEVGSYGWTSNPGPCADCGAFIEVVIGDGEGEDEIGAPAPAPAFSEPFPLPAPVYLGFTLATEIPADQVTDLLTTAFEGGSNYWYRKLEPHFGTTGLALEDFREGGKMQVPGCYRHWAELVPLVVGCHLTLEDKLAEGGDDRVKTLGREQIERGLGIMRDKYPRHFGDVLSDGGDATTGDVFLQCCVFGDVVYG